MTVWQRIHYIWVRAGLLVLVLTPVAMFLMFRAQGLPHDTFESSAQIRVVESGESIRFEPRDGEAIEQAWILVPGCPADPRAYGPLARAVAARGFLSVIVEVPFRCAPWPPHQAELRARVLRAIDTCAACRWTLAGHSRGVRHVLEMVRALPAGAVDALLLMASTHPREDDYSDLRLPVTKIVGSHDGVAPLDAAQANRALLPPSTRWEVIEGGNHSQFAHYGFQLFDGRATISREEQQRRLVTLVVSSLSDKK